MNNSELIVISHCKNCGTNVEYHKYCPNCGAKKITKRITFKNLLAEIGEVHLNLDNSIFRTIKDLTIKPYIVIDGYINGLRKKYLNIISYFLLSITLAAILSYFKEIFFDIQPEIEKLDDKSEYYKLYIKTIKKFPTLAYFTLIPLYSLFSLFIFRTYKKYNFIEHIVINTYLIAHITILSFIPYIIVFSLERTAENTSIVFTLIQYIYAAFLFKNLYNISYTEVIKKGLKGFFNIFIIVFIILLIIKLAEEFLNHYGFTSV